MSIKRDYSDIINHERWEPKKHPRMSIYNRASQFHPFDFSGQTQIDKGIAKQRLLESGGYDAGLLFDDDNEIIENNQGTDI